MKGGAVALVSWSWEGGKGWAKSFEKNVLQSVTCYQLWSFVSRALGVRSICTIGCG